MSNIHPTAQIAPGADIGEGVDVGPYTIIGPNVRIGDGTRVMGHVYLDGFTTIGEKCRIFPFTSIGTETQDLKYSGGKTYVVIGDRTTLREYVTVNSSTEEGEVTRVGSDCLIMAYCHVAHKCEVGDRVIMANCAQLAGHVVVQDEATVGGMVGVHQFVRIGRMSFVGGFSRITQDVPPFFIVEGTPAQPRGVNSVGLKRRNVPTAVRTKLKEAFRILYREELSTQQAITRIRESVEMCPEVEDLVAFIEYSGRGISK
jgi:UDP-N-acetylglucosamine acyltransferase